MIKTFLMSLSIFVMLSEVQAIFGRKKPSPETEQPIEDQAVPQKSSRLREAFRRKPAATPNIEISAPSDGRLGPMDPAVQRHMPGAEFHVQRTQREADLKANKDLTVQMMEQKARKEKILEKIKTMDGHINYQPGKVLWGALRAAQIGVNVTRAGGNFVAKWSPERIKRWVAATLTATAGKVGISDELLGAGTQGVREGVQAFTDLRFNETDISRDARAIKTELQEHVAILTRGIEEDSTHLASFQKTRNKQDPGYQRIRQAKESPSGDTPAFIALAERYVLKVDSLNDIKNMLKDEIDRQKDKIITTKKLIQTLELDPQLAQKGALIKFLELGLNLDMDTPEGMFHDLPAEAGLSPAQANAPVHAPTQGELAQLPHVLGPHNTKAISDNLRSGAGILLNSLRRSIVERTALINSLTSSYNAVNRDVEAYKTKNVAIFNRFHEHIKQRLQQHNDSAFVKANDAEIKRLREQIKQLKNKRGKERQIQELQDQINARRQGRENAILDMLRVNLIIENVSGKLKTPASADLNTFKPEGLENKAVDPVEETHELVRLLIQLTLLDNQPITSHFIHGLSQGVEGKLKQFLVKKGGNLGVDALMSYLVGQLQALIVVQMGSANLNPHDPYVQFMNKMTELSEVNNRIVQERDKRVLSQLKREQLRLQQDIEKMKPLLRRPHGRMATTNSAQQAQEAKSDIIDMLISISNAAEGPISREVQQKVQKYARKQGDGTKTPMGAIFALAGDKGAEAAIPMINGLLTAQLLSMHKDPTRTPLVNSGTAALLIKRLPYAKDNHEREVINAQIRHIMNDLDVKLGRLKDDLIGVGQNPTLAGLHSAKTRAKDYQKGVADFQADARSGGHVAHEQYRLRPASGAFDGAPPPPSSLRPPSIAGGHRMNPAQEFGEAPPPPSSLRPPSIAGRHRLRPASQEFGEAPPPPAAVRPPSMSGHRLRPP